ncbi:MAG: glutamine-hydrolyzing carbamoyl-phosphate synthase small subunit [Flavobacteriales bacterium]|nr:glutamine-hydrolyzing carbamoyl-phosphate synthase small subunit [Flavobacteriales bacterium]MCX7768016.1 glutamine-hydrolyzing carbamoyl-phosphate synthase small subunit [Flavobacteriales bacterium]MDW8409221.1 glutamine-hydrolyzing carbamoyl-phosphate synthase small subunit [Flavobacteriales bacterium]
MLSFPKAKLLLADGTRLEGLGAGATVTMAGELCFNTAMTGYQETYTDPSYYGQILISTAAHIGNYGVVGEDESESEKIQIKGLVCRNFSLHHSRYGAGPLNQWFASQGVPVMHSVDTRRLVRHIRTQGVINAVISTEEHISWEEMAHILNETPSMEGLQLSSYVSVKQCKDYYAPNGRYRVALLDLGVKHNIIRCLLERGCHVRLFSMSTTAADILEWQPDGLVISNGPGDPATLTHAISTVAELIPTGLPIFGICLGHQIIALSQGLKTYKMHHGHRGINHPVLCLVNQKGEITSQNHGFAVAEVADKQSNIIITHRHLNDHTVAGLELKDYPVFSVQYHPEASAGPHDSRYLFDKFLELIIKKKETKVQERHPVTSPGP